MIITRVTNKLGLASAVVTSIVLASVETKPTYAFQINSSAFGPSAVVESFENVSVGTNVRQEFAGYISPGINGPFTFASGVTLTRPIPNPGISQGVIVGDFSIGSAYFGLAGNGSVSAAEVPNGTAYLGLNSVASAGPIEFTFASDIRRIGAFVDSVNFGRDITLSAFDAANNLLETVSIASINVSQWRSNFLGVENISGIRKVAFNGDYLVLDNLKFESKSVPEPLTIGGTALAGGIGLLMKKRKAASQQAKA
ncbi:PEP-CTERM sorting domain-containing protein [Nostoc sp. T09]|uniref:PEP-CTERM sorting domain-containing protein n=1 Tax=Nostoc sp. T09 TaxID=1932621 RepID=UPI00117E7504|nr:PEP-CTERM sorting domain-containing protein [Nostoc sp. T09]